MVEENCSFCAGTFVITAVLYEDDELVVIRDMKPAGQDHWLMMPRRHIRDVESLTPSDLPLLHKMLTIRDKLIQQHFPTAKEIHCGFHRGKRRVVGGALPVPDIISVKHLHLHVIVEPERVKKFVKYNDLNPLVWIRIESVMERLKGGIGMGGAVGHEKEKVINGVGGEREL